MIRPLWPRWLPALTFVAVFSGHALYLRRITAAVAEGWADVAVGESGAWGFASYLADQEYWLGFSYALSAAFAAWSFVNFLSRRRLAMAAGAAGGMTAIGFLMVAGCFMAGCCGSPMLAVYAGWFGTKALGAGKPLVAGITALSVAASYWYLSRSGSRSCDSRCGCRTSRRDETVNE